MEKKELSSLLEAYKKNKIEKIELVEILLSHGFTDFMDTILR